MSSKSKPENKGKFYKMRWETGKSKPEMKGVYYGTHWKKILNEIYQCCQMLYDSKWTLKFDDDNHPMAKKLKISGEELDSGILFLERNGLIEIKGMKSSPRMGAFIIPELTKKGFDVCLDLEKNESNKNIQFGILVFTAVMVFTGSMGIITSIAEKIYAPSNKEMYILLLIGYIAGVVLLVFTSSRITGKVSVFTK